jgi:hypothetical protein
MVLKHWANFTQFCLARKYFLYLLLRILLILLHTSLSFLIPYRIIETNIEPITNGIIEPIDNMIQADSLFGFIAM